MKIFSHKSEFTSMSVSRHLRIKITSKETLVFELTIGKKNDVHSPDVAGNGILNVLAEMYVIFEMF